MDAQSPKRERIEFLNLNEVKPGDEIPGIQFVCGKCDRAEPYTPIPVKEINRGHIKLIAQSKCANAECREESGLNYRPDKEGDRVAKLEYLCDEPENLCRNPRLTDAQLSRIEVVMEGRNLKLRSGVKRVVWKGGSGVKPQ